MSEGPSCGKGWLILRYLTVWIWRIWTRQVLPCQNDCEQRSSPSQTVCVKIPCISWKPCRHKHAQISANIRSHPANSVDIETNTGLLVNTDVSRCELHVWEALCPLQSKDCRTHTQENLRDGKHLEPESDIPWFDSNGNVSLNLTTDREVDPAVGNIVQFDQRQEDWTFLAGTKGRTNVHLDLFCFVLPADDEALKVLCQPWWNRRQGNNWLTMKKKTRWSGSQHFIWRYGGYLVLRKYYSCWNWHNGYLCCLRLISLCSSFETKQFFQCILKIFRF